jgi:hypothetical protein
MNVEEKNNPNKRDTIENPPKKGKKKGKAAIYIIPRDIRRRKIQGFLEHL